MKKLNEQAMIRRIRSMEELKHEKARLRRELEFSGEKISTDYKLLLEAITLRNLLQMVIEEVVKTSNVFSQAFEIGRSLIRKRKKKKQETKAKTEGEPRKQEEAE